MLFETSALRRLVPNLFPDLGTSCPLQHGLGTRVKIWISEVTNFGLSIFQKWIFLRRTGVKKNYSAMLFSPCPLHTSAT